MTSPTMFQKLQSLSADRTARTERLHASIGQFLQTLEEHVEVGDTVIVDGNMLARVSLRSNVGRWECWSFSVDGNTSCDPERPVNGEGYLHGDFHAGWRGPTRAELIALAALAERFVEGFVGLYDTEADALDASDFSVQVATEIARTALPASLLAWRLRLRDVGAGSESTLTKDSSHDLSVSFPSNPNG